MDGQIVIGARIDTKSFDRQIEHIQQQIEDIEGILADPTEKLSGDDAERYNIELEKLNNKLVDLIKRKKEANEQNIYDERDTKRFTDGISKITKRITRMGLAMIGIRSLYGTISSSISRITQSNPELKAQIDAIKNAIDNVVMKLVELLLPVIQYIVNLVGRLLKYLFGVDIFSNKFNKNLDNANKTATKLRKQLMGFDEMNILSENGTTGALSGGTANVKVNLEFPDEGIFQKWLDKLKHNWDMTWGEGYDFEPAEGRWGGPTRSEVISEKSGGYYYFKQVMTQLEATDTAINNYKEMVSKWEKHVGDETVTFIEPETLKEFTMSIDDAEKLDDMITSGEIHSWHWSLFNGLDTELEAVMKEVRKIKSDKAFDIVGTTVTTGNKQTGEVVKKYIDDILDLSDDALAFVNLINDEDYKGFTHSVDKAGKHVLKRGKQVFKVSKDEYEYILNLIEQKGLEKDIKQTTNNIATDVEDALNGLFSNTEQETRNTKNTISGLIKNGLNYVESELKGATITYKNGMYEIQTISGKTYTLTTEEYNKYKDTFLNGIPVMTDNATEGAKTIENQNKISAKNSKDAWETAFTDIGNSAKDGANAIADKIKNALGGNDTKQDIIKNTNGALQEAVKTINSFVFPTKKVKVEPDTSNFLTKLKTAINNSASALALAVQLTIASTGGKKGAKGLMINAPRLASGGIINRPGRGVAIGGERGREAVIPLTDSQQMALLGQEIGKNVTIVATIPVSVGNRQVAREVRRINAEDEFGYNGGL